jgi:predicted aldo/keto reductase-like oxidoreductase
MSDSMPGVLSRRAFLQGASVAGGAAWLLSGADSSLAQLTGPSQALPRRVLGKTKQEVSTLALGTWPCGRSESVSIEDIGRLVQEALELGINFFDTAHNYGKAEEGIGRALGSRRPDVFLTTKVWADDAQEARQSLEESLRILRTDYLDVVYLHSVGNRDVQKALSSDGALSYLWQQKKAGKVRFVGISGHSMVDNFIPILATGQIDVVMMAMNFVDRHTYGFEDKVLPVANKHQVGVACMKVFGGMRGGFAVADGPNTGPQMNLPYLQMAVRYALGLPGVASLVIGPHTVDQLRQNVKMVREYQPLTEQEQLQLDSLGRQLATQWGPHYGPVA